MGAEQDPTRETLRRQILEALRALAPAVVAEVWADLVALPPYGTLSDEHGVAVRRSVDRVFEMLTTCLDEQRDPSPGEEAELMTMGAARARAGIPLDVVLDGFRKGSQRARHHLRRVASELGGSLGEAISSELLDRFVDLHAIGEKKLEAGYSQAMEILPDRLDGVGGLADAIVHGRLDQDGMRGWLGGRGLAPAETGTIAVAVAAVGPGGGDLAGLGRQLVQRLPGAVDATVVASPVPHLVLFGLTVWPGPNGVESYLKETADAYHVDLAVVTPVPSMAWPATYRRIQPIVEPLARRHPAADVYRPDDLLACELASFAPPDWARDRVREILGPALAHQRADSWFPTLAALIVEGGNVKGVTRRLGMPRSTVYDHIEAVRRSTALDLLDPRAAQRASLALWLMATHPDAMPPVGDASWSTSHQEMG